MTKLTISFVLFICISQIASLPSGFVYLRDIDPTIRQYPMYYYSRNSLGRPIDGYKAPKIILTEKAALALKDIQDDIRKDGYSLLITDGYRPQKAVNHFIRWSKDESDQKMKKYYYPYFNKQDSFKHGYIAKKSGHTRGSTIDLTIIEIGNTFNADAPAIKRKLTDGRSIYRWDDNTVDMFTSVDLMDLASWPDTNLVEAPYKKNRNYLREKMIAHNFEPNAQEWWHYTLINEPFNNTYFDFDVE